MLSRLMVSIRASLPPSAQTIFLGVMLLWCVVPPTAVSQDRTGRVAGFQARAYAITGARLVRGPGREDKTGTLVIRDGVIVSVGPKAAVPPDAVVIDGTGLRAYAGFIDADADDLLAPDARLPSPTGRRVNFSRYVLAATRPDNRKSLTPQFAVARSLKLDPGRLTSIRQQGFTGVQVVPDGRIASGLSALVSTAGLPPRESVIAQATLATLALRPVPGNGYPRTLMGAHAHLRQALLDTARHVQHRRLYEAETPGIPRPPSDDVLDALAPILGGQQRTGFRVRTRDDIHRALAFAAEHKIAPLLLGADAISECLEAIAALKPPVLLSLTWGSRPKVSAKTSASGKPLSPTIPEPLRVQQDKLDRWSRRVGSAASLEKLGIPVAVGSRGLKDRGEVLKAVRAAIQHGGWTPQQALASLTTRPAQILGVAGRVGTLDPGRLGHVVLWTGRFDDEESRVRYVFVDGVLFEYNKTAIPRPDQDEPPSPARPGQAVPRANPTAETQVPPPPPLPRTSGLGSPQLPSEIESDRLRRALRTGGNVFISDATVLTGTGKTLPHHSILITNGKIAALGPDLTAPGQVAVIDASGHYVMPGIIDTHSHIKITQGINESTQSIVPEVRVKDVINTEDVSEYRALAGGVTTARLLHGSANVVGGQDAVVKLKYGTTAAKQLLDKAPQGVKFALGENVKFRTTRFPNTRMGVEATLNRAFLEAIDYRRRWQQYERSKKSQDARTSLPPRRDLRLEALADIVNHEKFIHSHCYRADEILMLLRVAESLGIRVWSLQHVLEGYKIAPEIAAHGASCSTFADWWAYKVEAYDATPYNAALLSEAGANVVIKSDDPELIRHLHQEAAKPVRYGNLDPDKALATVTLNAARELGLDRRTGSIEVGKDGDLAIYNAHPLNTFARCEWTLIDGEVYFSRHTHPTAMSAEARQKTARPPSLPLVPAASRRAPTILPPDQPRVDGFPREYAILGGTLHPVSGQPIRGDLLIQDGKITSLGEDIGIPATARIIKAKGLHVFPGLIDAGTTLGLAEIKKVRETLDFQEGGDLQPDLRAGVAINPDSELFPVARAGGITTALVHPTGGLVAGQASLVQLAGWTAPQMVIDYGIGLRVHWPTDSSDARRKQRADEFRILIQQARQYHQLKQAAAKSRTAGPIGDPRLDALQPFVTGKKPVLVEAHSRQSIVEAIAFAESEKLRIIITGGTNAWKVAAALKARDIPVIVGPVMRSPVKSWDPSDAPYANPGRLHEAGVRFCIRSDNASNSRNAPFEAGMAVAYGLPAEAALRSVTLSAAEILGIESQVGSLEAGKRANIVILDGSPLQVTSQVKGIFVDGQPFRPESRQTRFYHRYRHRLLNPPPKKPASVDE